MPTSSRKKPARSVLLPVPFVEQTGERTPCHMALELRSDEATALHGLLKGLLQVNAKLNNGRGVSSYADAARWLFQQLAKSGETIGAEKAA